MAPTVNARRRAEDMAMESDCFLDLSVAAASSLLLLLSWLVLPSSLATNDILVLNNGSLATFGIGGGDC